jgi:hypothetical protein
MARSIKKRIQGAKPKSRKSQLKFIKRMLENQKVLNILSNK